ncbi:hypothetical protein ACJZ2D_016757 [Fusarium nematophilum]
MPGARVIKAAILPAELSLDAFESTFCLSRLLDNFVWSAFGAGWIREAATGKLGPLPFEAMTALSQTNFGRQEQAAKLRLKGAERYGRTLRAMVDTLSKKGPASADDLIIPILLLIIHSMYYPYRQWEAFMARVAADDESKWETVIDADHMAAVSHLEGLAKIIYVCGPEGFQTTVKQKAFDSSRMFLTIDSLYKRKRIYLEEHRWRTIPWALNPPAKLPQSKLLDFLAYVPGFLEDYYALEAAEVYSKYGAGVKLEKADKVFRASPDHLRHRCLKFDYHENSNVRAGDITLYNALHLWMIALLWKVEPLSQRVPAIIVECAKKAALASPGAHDSTSDLPGESTSPSDPPSFAPLAGPGECVGLRSPAMEILRVYEWQCRNHHITGQSTEPIYLYMFPFGMAMGILDKEPEIGEWITEMAGTSIHTAAYTVGRFKKNGFARFITKAMMDPELPGAS